MAAGVGEAGQGDVAGSADPGARSPARTAARMRGLLTRGVTRGARLIAFLLVLALVVLIVITAVVRAGPPTREELLERAGLVGKTELWIGVNDDQPGVAFRDPRTGVYSGFDIDVALMVAADLGFGRNLVRFFPVESEDRARMLARAADGGYVTVDLVVASYGITREREEQLGVTFSAPYLQTEQSVVTRPDYPGSVETLQDLRGRPVCGPATGTSAVTAEQAGVGLMVRGEIHECVKDLLDGRVEAVTADAAILAGFVAEYPKRLRHHDIASAYQEWWGINTGGNDALRDLVNLSLYKSRNDPLDRRWEDAYDRHLRPEQPANLPQQVAVDRQPTVEKVEVRR